MHLDGKSMAQRQGPSWFRFLGLCAGGLAAMLVSGTNTVLAGNGHGNGHGHGHGHDDDDDGPGYKGTANLSIVSVGPNVARCGNAPNIELIFEGSGLDTAGGITSVESSACQNPTTGEVFDLVAVDTYATGSLEIVSEDFFLVFDPQTCVSTNIDRVKFDVGGGTGAFAGVTGGGTYDIAIDDPACSGEVVPASVWFHGDLD
jgi:hypothetical protein